MPKVHTKRYKPTSAYGVVDTQKLIEYKVNDFVFTQMRGYPPWPSQIMSIKQLKNRKEYTVWKKMEGVRNGLDGT